MEDRNLTFKEVNNLIRERCERILEKFGQVAVSGVRNPKLLVALEDVKKYWRDFNRPSLTFFSCEAVGGTYEIAQDAALMFTLASSGFGIHDDILDRSKNKHLRMTILGLHGIDTALLVGDLLIVKAWTLSHELIRKTGNPTKIANILKTYGNLSVEICEAEFMETQCRQRVDIDVDYYENVLWREVAEIEACSRIGAMMGDGKPNEIEALSDFGRRLGFISRLKDEVEDCLNIKGDLPHRLKYESVPLPLLYAAKSSFEKQKRLKKIVDKKMLLQSDIKFILNLCFKTEAFEYVRKLAKRNWEEAHRGMSILKVSTAQKILLDILDVGYSRIDELCV
ncbi:MAG: polyprenyl synthetase family protein [Candidatus Hodarchaeota archaeon]